MRRRFASTARGDQSRPNSPAFSPAANARLSYIDHYTHLGHLKGHVHGVNYKLAGPLAAIGLRRLRGLGGQLRSRRTNARRLLDALPGDSRLVELGYEAAVDQPNYYNLVLAISAMDAAKPLGEAFADAGLAPDSVRYGYRPLYHRPIFERYATVCPNAERLAATTLYPGGHVDSDEDPAQAAVREVAEETGIQAVVLGEPAFTHPAVASHAAPWAVIEMAVTDSKVGAHRHIDFVYVCRVSGGDLAAQLEEVAEVRWAPVADLAELATPAELSELVAAAARWAKTHR